MSSVVAAVMCRRTRLAAIASLSQQSLKVGRHQGRRANYEHGHYDVLEQLAAMSTSQACAVGCWGNTRARTRRVSSILHLRSFERFAKYRATRNSKGNTERKTRPKINLPAGIDGSDG